MGMYLNVKASLLKYCKEFNQRHSLGFDIFDFDAHTTINELPDVDLIGIGDYSLDNDGELITVSCLIGVVTKADDHNLNRLSPVIDKLITELYPNKVDSDLVVVTATDGLPYGQLKLTGQIAALPVSRTMQARPYQTVAVTFVVTIQ